MLTVNKLTKKYGDHTALNIESLNINKGELFGLAGNNGAGKTTLFSCILDLIRPNSGNVSILNQPVNKSSEWKHITGSYLDESFLIDFLTPMEYIKFVASSHNIKDADISIKLEPLMSFIGDELINTKKYIRDLSTGNKVRIGIAGAIFWEPEVVILDEPFAHLDPSSQIKLKNLLKEYNERTNAAILVSSHDLRHVTDLCSRIVLLHDGELNKDIKTSSNTLQELEEYFSIG
ncbi:ABC transporter ATP-binding protein [Flammeovirgaceae bacterium KN852]|uniref:ABC transporter ATP-binding protein n=1 Tax=Marinigracilibium pacificum TaxID=2729599 RepID=A0A848IWG6_9BACT|nr:ABC transporter ATP-binding protein [Marinigracilibium pacificum]